MTQALESLPEAPRAATPGAPRQVPQDGSPEAKRAGFEVRVPGFEGPFDLLLALIAKHRIEVTEVALHVVTDDFVAHVRQQGETWDLDEATSFLVIAATLLDLKAARLLPDGTVADEEELALLEVRDLIFARLLQYRAFKEVSALLSALIEAAGRQVPRTAGPDPWLARLLPDVELGLTPAQFAQMAARCFQPKPAPPEVSTAHLHSPRVSVPEQAAILAQRLRDGGSATFWELCDDAGSRLVVVGRFLALLELYRQGHVRFDQAVALGDLRVEWTEAPAVHAQRGEGRP